MLPASPLDGLLSAFDSSGSRFVIATPDGRARTYDTGTYVEVDGDAAARPAQPPRESAYVFYWL